MSTSKKKSRFVGVRLEPAQLTKLIVLSVQAGEPGNISAGLRFAVDRIQPEVRQVVSTSGEKTFSQ